MQAASRDGTADRRPVVVVGSVNADLVLRVPRLPRPGETLNAADLRFFPGGKGANTAAAAARLGHPTHFIGAVGADDANADALRSALQQAGVQLEHLCSVPGPCGTAVILLQEDGENSIVIVGGANQEPAAWQLSERAEQLISSAGMLLLQREIPEHVNMRVAQLAAAAGVPVLLDAGGADAPLPDALLRHISILSPNETELSRLTGLPTEGDVQLLAAAQVLCERADAAQHSEEQQQQQQQQPARLQVLLKLGAQGSMLLGADDAPQSNVLRQQAVPPPAVVDTTGAGDCFTAAFAVGLLRGLGSAEAMRFAATAASICVSRSGAMPSLPGIEEVQALL